MSVSLSFTMRLHCDRGFVGRCSQAVMRNVLCLLLPEEGTLLVGCLVEVVEEAAGL